MKKRVLFPVTLILFITLCILMCNNPIKKKDTYQEKNITVHGNLLPSRTAPLPDSIVAVPIINGIFAEDWDKLPHAFIYSNGTFGIELYKTRIKEDKTVENVDWILLLLNSKAINRFDRVIGYLMLNQLDQSLIKFPLSKAKVDSINMGTVTQNGDEAKSDSTIKNDTTTFNLTIAQLAEMAKTGKTLKMIKNTYGNYDPSTKKVFDVRPTYTLAFVHLSDAENKELMPATYIDTAKIYVDIQFFFAQSLINYQSLVNKTATVDLYPPTALYCMIDTSKVLLAQGAFLSTKTEDNPSIVTNGTTVAHASVFVIGEDNAQYNSIIFPSIKGIAPNGTWYMKKDRNTTLAMFDFGLGNPFDSTNGKPRIYVPSVKVIVNPVDTTVSQIQVKWYVWAQNGYVEATDVEPIRSNVSFAEISIRDAANQTESALYGSLPHGTVSTQLVPAIINFTPTKKFVYKKPVIHDGKFTVIFYYVTGSQAFSIRIEDHTIISN